MAIETDPMLEKPSAKERRQWFRISRKKRQQARNLFKAACMTADLGPRTLARMIRDGDPEAELALRTAAENNPQWDIDLDRLKEILQIIFDFLKMIMTLFV